MTGMNYKQVQYLRKIASPQYALADGDNPALLDRRFGFPYGTVAKLNPGLDYTKLQIGQKLNMPDTWKAPSYYTLAKGDTMQGLDRKYNLPIGSFEKANPKLDYNRLQIGQQVMIPYKQPAVKQPATAAQPAGSTAYTDPSDYVLNGILMQESLNGKLTEGDILNGKAYSVGPYQIREVKPGAEYTRYNKARAKLPRTNIPVIDDVNDAFHTNYTAEDRKDAVKAREITKAVS